MPNTRTSYPAGPGWTHRGTLPPVSVAQAQHAIAMCLIDTPGCTSLSLEPIQAVIKLGSGRDAAFTAEICSVPGGLGLRLDVESHPDDVAEVVRVHEQIVSRYPEFARASAQHGALGEFGAQGVSHDC